MNRREEMIRLTAAAPQADRILRAPAVKLSITGIRPVACRANTVITDADAGRQEHTHVLARRGHPAQRAAEREGGPDQISVAERTPVLVLDDRCRAVVRSAGIDERAEQRAPTLGRYQIQRRSLFHQAPQPAARGLPAAIRH
jgi:hypothetical protein